VEKYVLFFSYHPPIKYLIDSLKNHDVNEVNPSSKNVVPILFSSRIDVFATA
jgi:hypothetical protein